MRDEQRRRLVDFVRERSMFDRVSRGEPRRYVEAAHERFDPGVLTVGFARRLATYKRLHLLMLDVHRALALIAGDRPIQLLIAGKAHPRDDEGKRLVQNLLGGARGRAGRRARRVPRGLRPVGRRAARRAAATCGSTSRARRSRPAARAG